MEGAMIMPEIRPIKDLRNTAEISKLCRENKDPIFITKNGYGEMVVMSIETYEKKLAKAALYEKLAKAETQWESGAPPEDAEEVFKRLKEKYGE